MFCVFTYFHFNFIMFCFLFEMFILGFFVLLRKVKHLIIGTYLAYLIKISSNTVSLNDSLSLMLYNWCWWLLYTVIILIILVK